MARPTSSAETGALADRIADAVLACDGVARLAGGPLATYLPGRVVRGVAIGPQAVDIMVVARYGQPLFEIAERVRAAVARVAVGAPINVLIADLETPAEP